MNQLRDWYKNKEGVPEISILNTVLSLREQRAGMVQTKNQYVFIFTSLLFEHEHIKKELAQGTKVSIGDMEKANQQLSFSRRGRQGARG